MEREQLRAVVEGILLTARGPVAEMDVVESLAEEKISREEVAELLGELAAEADQARRGMRFEQVAGGWRAVVPAHLDPYLRAYHGMASRQRLSQAAVEVLAIVSHRQPVTLPEINFIRGANSAAVVRTLLDRKLIRMAGRKRVVGKPFLYRTTKEFLVHFGLESLDELPDPDEMVSAAETREPS